MVRLKILYNIYNYSNLSENIEAYKAIKKFITEHDTYILNIRRHNHLSCCCFLGGRFSEISDDKLNSIIIRHACFEENRKRYFSFDYRFMSYDKLFTRIKLNSCSIDENVEFEFLPYDTANFMLFSFFKLKEKIYDRNKNK